MSNLINQLREPELHYPGNFDTVKRANAMLMCLCQEAADLLEAQAKEIAELREQVFWLNAARPNIAVVAENERLKAICDQMGAALDSISFGMDLRLDDEDLSSETRDVFEALTAWMESK